MVVLNEKMKQSENAPLLQANDEQPFKARLQQYHKQVLSTETQTQYTVMRRVVYCVFLFLNFAQLVFFGITVLPRGYMFVAYTSIPCLVIAAISFIWVLILLGYHDRPHARVWLCKARTHFISFKLLALLWIAPAIVSPISAGLECSVSYIAWCTYTSIESILSYILVALSIYMAMVIHRNARKFGAGLDGNIAYSDEGHIRLPTDEETTEVSEVPGENSLPVLTK